MISHFMIIDVPPEIKRGTSPIINSSFEGLELIPEQLFQQAGIP
ncbi:hypothetical protein [Lyngbya sp. PCC 8106]|nr:hypothetical protein [Lyngbya sp. PCC 8106]